MIVAVSLLVLGLLQFTLALFGHTVGQGYTALLLWLEQQRAAAQA